jgi:hypothetical protein
MAILMSTSVAGGTIFVHVCEIWPYVQVCLKIALLMYKSVLYGHTFAQVRLFDYTN